MRADWPELHYDDWAGTCAALHLWVQIAGKYRLARTPWVNHSWHATLYVTPRGLTTGPVPDKGGPDTGGYVTLSFDFPDSRLIAESSTGARNSFALGPMSVAAFFAQTKDLIASVGGDPSINGKPNEVPDAVPFAEDTAPRPYDAAAVARFHAALISIERVFQHFRTGYLGKSSPVHLFWGSFDLAVTRFSGRDAPPHPGGIPNLPDTVTREAYSHEVASAGFWPGTPGGPDASFYAYAYPAPPGFADRTVAPDAAGFDKTLGEFLLPYEAVRTAADPEAALMAFLQSAYEAAAETGGWRDPALECDLGIPGVPRPVPAA
mgnify:CR=1 FL=1